MSYMICRNVDLIGRCSEVLLLLNLFLLLRHRSKGVGRRASEEREREKIIFFRRGGCKKKIITKHAGRDEQEMIGNQVIVA